MEFLHWPRLFRPEALCLCLKALGIFYQPPMAPTPTIITTTTPRAHLFQPRDGMSLAFYPRLGTPPRPRITARQTNGQTASAIRRLCPLVQPRKTAPETVLILTSSDKRRVQAPASTCYSPQSRDTVNLFDSENEMPTRSRSPPLQPPEANPTQTHANHIAPPPQTIRAHQTGRGKNVATTLARAPPSEDSPGNGRDKPLTIAS